MRFPRQCRWGHADALPNDVVELLCEFVVGVGIFTLSHVNRNFYRQLSGVNVWAHRVFSVWPLSAPDDAVMERCWQERAYTQSNGLLSLPRRRPRDRGYFGTTLAQDTPPRGARHLTICAFNEDESPGDVVCWIAGHHTVSVVPGRWYHLAWCFGFISNEFEMITETPRNNKRIATNATNATYEHCYSGELRSSFVKKLYMVSTSSYEKKHRMRWLRRLFSRKQPA